MSTKTSASSAIAMIAPAGLSFFNEGLSLGVRKWKLHLALEGAGAWVVSYDTIGADGKSGTATDPSKRIKVHTTIEVLPGGKTIIVGQRLENLTTTAQWVSDVAFGQVSGDGDVQLGKGHGLGWNYRYTHTDNVRTERYPHCTMEYPLVRPLPVETLLLGGGEDQPFPAAYFWSTAGGTGLVIGAGSQNKAFQTFEIRNAPLPGGSVFTRFLVNQDFRQAGGVEIPAGGSVELDSLYIEMTEQPKLDAVYRHYTAYVASKHKFLGPSSPMLTEALQCTWNYGVFADQQAEALLKTAAFISKNLPGIKYFLMDAGYTAPTPMGDSWLTNGFADRFYPDPDAAVDLKKHPKGIRHFSDQVRALGLKPGIWWSPTVRLDSQLYKDHPDWFLRDSSGGPYRIGDANGYLDLSVQGAVDYLDRTLEHILRKWNFDALKMDFWSQNFEDRDGRQARTRISSIESRKILFDIIRKHLPKDGVFVTCVATGMGNPFVATHADAYRNTIDIGAGHWWEQVNNSFWALPTLLNAGRETFLLNIDSVGINLDLSDDENYFRLTWCWITMGMQETGGRLELLPPKWVAAMRKFTDRCDRGYAVRCPDTGAFTGVPLPECLYVDFPEGSATSKLGVKQSIAMFNWSDQAKIVSVARADLGHVGAVKVENFWTGEKSVMESEFISLRMPPHSSMLWDVV